MLVLREQDTNSKHEVSVGTRIEIRLSERPTTGYAWRVEGNLSCFSVAGDRFEPPTTQTLGAAGQHVWELQATAPGEDEIVLEYRRAWENKPAASRFAATIRVLPPR